MVKKFRVGLALQPVTTALFANSPFREGRPNGFLSYRAHVWTDVDNARSGMLPFVFEDGLGFERYVDYALDVPMYFVYRDGRYIDVAGKSFRDFLARKIPEAGRVRAVDVGLGRSSDDDLPGSAAETFPGNARRRWRRDGGGSAACRRSGSASITTAWRWMPPGTWSRTGRRKSARRCAMRCRTGLQDPVSQATVHDLAHRMLEISTAGLRRRAQTDSIGGTEEGFLQPLVEIVNRGYTRAEELLRNFEGPWGHDMAQLFSAYNFL